jgi:hypothetical protein
VDTGIAKLDPEDVSKMHAFKRRFLVDAPEEARKHLLAHWGFDAMEDDQVADLSENENPCRLTNAAFEPFGQGQALQCGGQEAGTKGHAEVKPAGAIQDAVTLCAWIKLGPKQHKGAAGVVERPQFYRLMVDQTEPPYSISLSVKTRSGWRSARTLRTISPGQWVHVAGTYDAEVGETAMYLNGKQVGKSSGQPGRIPAVSGAIDVGVRDGSAYLTGSLDEVRIYGRALGSKAIAPLAKQP